MKHGADLLKGGLSATMEILSVEGERVYIPGMRARKRPSNSGFRATVRVEANEMKVTGGAIVTMIIILASMHCPPIF